jgi:hypothetical protein
VRDSLFLVIEVDRSVAASAAARDRLHSDFFIARLPEGLDTPLGHHGHRRRGRATRLVILPGAVARAAPAES